LAKKDPEAFAMIYDEYVDDIYSYIYSFTGNQQETEDLTAQTFFNALKSIKRFECQKMSFAAWLFKISRNLVISFWRKNKPIVSMIKVDNLVCYEDNPECQIIQNEVALLINNEVKKLPKTQGEVIVLKFIHELSNKEIAKIIGRSVGAVEQLLYRAKQNLRKKMEQ
jgi:RNA polymerase sigma-70 factor, ECF subfamily